MAVYTVHEPPPKRFEQTSDPERFAFVRDGFSFSAFVFGPLWMLWHRMWLALVGYVGVSAALELVFSLLSTTAAPRLVAGFLLAILVGIESATLRRFTLGRRRWTNLGVIVADDLEAAERRFFDVWVKSGGAAPRTTSEAQSRQLMPAPDVIGLFPQPGTQAGTKQ
jgi:Protein of unknown function (DUF2628)